MKMPKSKRGAWRVYNAIMNKARREMAGGLNFGMDWPTFRSSYPEEAAFLVEVKKAYPSLPD